MIFSQILIKAGLRASPKIKNNKANMLCFSLQKLCAAKTKDFFTITTSAWPETHPSLWLSAMSKCLWRSPAWWGTALPTCCLEGCQAENHQIDRDMHNLANTMKIRTHFPSFKSRLTFKFFSNWQQVHSTSLICLSQGMVRSLERAKDTYQTWEPQVRTVTETQITH